MHLEIVNKDYDINSIVEIYNNARVFMRKNGNLEQWSNGYPNREVILNDIKNGNLYLVMESNVVIGIFALIRNGDPCYKKIDGEWLNNNSYFAIHRIASTFVKKGFLQFVISYVSTLTKDIRIDTHKDNIPMQRALEKLNFIKCGIIYLESGDPRLAYHLHVN